MRVIMRTFSWDMGHRVMNHESKCKQLHGHRYRAMLYVREPDDRLDELGRVIDFGVIKETVGMFIDEEWDHRTMLCQDDELARILGPQHTVIVAFNPTAENIAEKLYNVAESLLEPHGIEVARVELYETPNCSAIYEEDKGFV